MSDLVIHERGPQQEPVQSLVILLHGLGADGRDLIDLADYWGDVVPHTKFVSPDAPEPCDMAPTGRQWFSLQDWSFKAMEHGAQNARPVLDAFIDSQLAKYNLKAGQCGLMGFSQGAMMALYTAPRRDDRLAGVLSYSGLMLGGDDLLNNDDRIQKSPVHLMHGEQDDLVPFNAWHDAWQKLKKAGFSVSGRSIPGLGHGIDPEGIHEGGRFLKDVLSA
jgi:phospholipase/carboxylesterase